MADNRRGKRLSCRAVFYARQHTGPEPPEMHAALIAAVLALLGAPPQFVEQEVECVSIAHLESGSSLVFYWSTVQNDWTLLDHRWASPAMSISRDGDSWVLSWHDESIDGECYRIVRTKCWVESFEYRNPLDEVNQRPWFRQLLEPGLRQPPRVAAGGAK